MRLRCFPKDSCYQRQMLGFVEKIYEAQVLVWNECQVLREVAGAYQSQVLKKYESQVLKSMRVRCGKSQVLKKI